MQNKNIIRFCFLSIFFIVIANIVLYRQLIVENVIVDKISSSNKLLADTYVNYISGILRENPHFYIKKGRGFQVNEGFIRRHSDEYFNMVKFLKVVIEDTKGRVVYDSNNVQITPMDTTKIRAGKDISVLLDNIIFKKLVSDKRLMINALVRYSDHKYAKLNIVYSDIMVNTSAGTYKIRIYKDITELWHKMSWIEVKIFFAITFFFLLLFVVIVYNTRYAQKIINRQSEANKQLADAKKKAELESSLKSQFLANVSHELRTPLNSIIGFSEIILSDKEDKKKLATNLEYINDIYDSGKHLLAVINDILDYSKIISGQLTLDMIDLNINKIVKYSIRAIEPRADKSGVKLIQDFPDASPVIKADSKRLRQALLNVLSNAVKFTPEGGSITIMIKAPKHGRKVSIKIIDTGIGIAKANIPKALSSFQQIDDKKGRQYEGTGLGLPITKRLVELMGAEFQIESKEGKGTTVTFIFNEKGRG